MLDKETTKEYPEEGWLLYVPAGAILLAGIQLCGLLGHDPARQVIRHVLCLCYEFGLRIGRHRELRGELLLDFQGERCKKKYVVIKYILVWFGSIGLNTWGVYGLTESIQRVPWVQQTLSHVFDDLFIVCKVVVSLLVGWFWNYNLHRSFVYRDCKIRRPIFLRRKSLSLETEVEKVKVR